MGDIWRRKMDENTATEANEADKTIATDSMDE